MSVGHNAMAGFIYFLTFIAFLVQCLTGFGLYASMGSWWFPQMFAWVPSIISASTTGLADAAVSALSAFATRALAPCTAAPEATSEAGSLPAVAELAD
jgi:hypothetical protein